MVFFLPTDLSMLLFSYLLFTVYHAWLCTHCLYTRAPSPLFLHTHWVAFWWSWICMSRYWMFYFIDQVFVEIVCALREVKVFIYWLLVFLSLLHSCCLLDSLYIIISRYSIFVFICYHVWTSTCRIAVILIYHSKFL